ncbi:hypothetical protein [Micromonospora sediminicola]|uniref:hypothetical protein n=1 Tax=Micromonospora sediminicola TaxID=946078 RepID=UPI0037A07042
MTCTATRHGTYSAYRHGCRCPAAREDWRLYNKRRRENRAKPLRLDGTEVRRRIQTLWAAGHSCTTIGQATGTNMSRHHIKEIAHRTYTSEATLTAIRRAYTALAMIPGTSEITRRRALAAGYRPPLAWDDNAIDDPDAAPAGAPDTPCIDVVAVDRALTGVLIQLTDAERQYAVHVGRACGMSTAELAAALHLAPRSVTRIAARPLPTYELVA